MASSLSARNVASVFENDTTEFSSYGIRSVKRITKDFVELHCLCLDESNLQVKSKKEDCEEEWQLLSSTIAHRSSSEANVRKRRKIGFLTLWAKKTSADASLYFEVDNDFLKSLEKLSPSFHVVGTLNVSRDSRSEHSRSFSYNGNLESGCGELFREAASNDFFAFMTSGTNNWRFYFNWSLYISWDPKKIIKLGLNNIVAKMYSCEHTKDLTIVVGNGTEVKCHKFIFAAHSSVLAAMIAPESGMQEAKTARVELKDLSEEGIGSLLPYFYGMELTISKLNCDVAAELIQAAHKYGLPELEAELEKVLMKKDSNWFTPAVLLELYYFSKNVEKLKKLELHTLKIMTRIPDAMKECDRFKELKQAEQLSLSWVLISYMSTLLRAHPC